jgi:1-deoxy-D-xylulose-5-phosphate synthase
MLEKLDLPSDLKRLTIDELNELAREIRQTIIDVLAINGGHLGSNLGVVELSIALHAVFDSPLDKMIFDVSHQTYPHKILTGRLSLFPKIRQYKGLCGFSHPRESIHDHFFAGHAGTALSLALGVATARDIAGGCEAILPILGDAALTCGLTLEALNNIPKHLKRFIVILNDNAMSISPNVGAITHILNRDNPTSTVTYFEQFGLSYVGPIDGHQIEQLIETLEKVKNSQKPILLHVLTVKGKGMEKAIQNPIPYHGCKPFDKVTGDFLKSTASSVTFPQIFGKEILKMAEEDPTLVTITPATPAGSCLEAFMEKFPNRCLDVGIAEGHAVTFCGGLAHSKKIKVVICIYATFLQRALDNLFQDVCLQEIPVIFALDRGGISAGDGSTHHGIYDIGFLQAMPNMVICQPRSGQLLKELLHSSFSWNRPVAIRYPNQATTEDENAPLQKRPLGKAEILSPGSGILIIGLGVMCFTALEVKKLLLREGINATVVDPIFVKPLDGELFSELLLTHETVVTIEEHAVQTGLGAIINSFILQKGFQEIDIFNFGIPDLYLEQGTHKELLIEIGLHPEAIAATLVNSLRQRANDRLDIPNEEEHAHPFNKIDNTGYIATL